MAWTIALSLLTIFTMIGASLFKPNLKIHKLSINTYWIIPSLGALILLSASLITFPEILAGLTADTTINPLKILALFLSMTLMSIFLDEVGLFRFLATYALKKAKINQLTMFITLYALVSFLTIFTSNDIIILTFTPFICYFAKRAKIDPIPYLFASFVAANTWSMMLIIGNPTNIYLASSHGILFLEYAKVMILPTIFASLTSFGVLLLIFQKKLSSPISEEVETAAIKDKFMLFTGLIALGGCTFLLTISNYIELDMYLITLIFATSLLVVILLYKAFKKSKPTEVAMTLRRLPWDLIPFIISMFVIVLALDKHGATRFLASFFSNSQPIVKYGISSFLIANFINNIPMSVLYSSVTSYASSIVTTEAVYASIVGSNLGGFLMPMGALAGMMWMGLLKSHGVTFSFLSFVKYGVLPAFVALAAALLGLFIVFI
ncbi:MAG: SLC13 family permease [Bacilli bacterium]|jgi:arsenical pump membrane protein